MFNSLSSFWDRLTPKFLCYAVAFFGALFLATLEVDGYVDRDNYLTYASASLVILIRYFSESVVTTVFNEPLWLLVNVVLSLFFSPESVLKIVIFFSSFVTSYAVLSHVEFKNVILVVLFLTLPLVLKNNIIHIRQGLAVSVFLCGWFSGKGWFKYSLFLFAALIHSSFVLIVVGIISINSMYYLRLSSGVRNILYIIVGLAVGLGVVFAANYLGARQAGGYQSVVAGGSGLGFVFWGGVLSFFLVHGRSFLNRHPYAVFFVILYLSTYFFLPFSARILESVMMVILLATLDFRPKLKLLFILYYLIFYVLLWSGRVGMAGFGWGVENYI